MLVQEFEEHARILAEMIASQLPDLEDAAQRVESCLRQGGKLLVLGNGGSAADAQHFTAELVGRFEHDRRALPAVALTANTSTVTAVGNDYGFDQIFARQVEALAAPGDVLIAISTSGNSSNVLAAAGKAHELGCTVIGLTGEGGGRLAGWAEVLVAVPSRKVSRIQEMHAICLHALAGWLERRLFAGDAPKVRP